MYTEQEQDLIVRAKHMSKAAIGKPFTVKLSKPGRANKVTCAGTIVECEFGRFDSKRGGFEVVFKIVMEVGPNKIRREFHVARIPQ